MQISQFYRRAINGLRSLVPIAVPRQTPLNTIDDVLGVGGAMPGDPKPNVTGIPMPEPINPDTGFVHSDGTGRVTSYGPNNVKSRNYQS